MDEPNGEAASEAQPGTSAGEQPRSGTAEQPGPAAAEPPGAAHADEQPNEQDLRAAYEAELNRITSSDLILQTTVSLINIGGRRLGLTAPGAAPAASERDLDQVRDAIDGARALMPILERHMAGELGPMRDAIAQLQMAYAREVQAAPAATPAASPPPSAPQKEEQPATPANEAAQKGPGPAQASGRLWVPGR
jgi:hypothetical protein